jgi:hypothetical protein
MDTRKLIKERFKLGKQSIREWFILSIECRIMQWRGYTYHLRTRKEEPESGWYKAYDYFHFAKPCWKGKE